MTLGDLIAAFRAAANDRRQPHLWQPDDLTRYANEAENEACRRARLLVDSTTPDVAVVKVARGDPLVPLDPRVIFIRTVRLASSGRALCRWPREQLDSCHPNWDKNEGTLDAFITNWQTGFLRLYRIPLADDVLNMTVIRTPLRPMVDLTDKPEIAPRAHDSLVHWMLYKAFSVPDEDLQDKKKALEALALFEQEFGPKSSLLNETWINAHYDADEGEF